MKIIKLIFNIISIIFFIIIISSIGTKVYKRFIRSDFEARELCLKKNKGKDISSCNEVPPHFLRLVDKIKKLEKKNLEKSEIDRKIIIKKFDK